MPGVVKHVVEPGGLSPEHHERILALAEKGLGPHRIAKAISKHPSTVGWFMYRNGLRRLRPVQPGKRFVRGGREVRQFSEEEDAFIQELRVDGLKPRRIAELATERFGHPRRTSSIFSRLTVLAGREDG